MVGLTRSPWTMGLWLCTYVVTLIIEATIVFCLILGCSNWTLGWVLYQLRPVTHVGVPLLSAELGYAFDRAVWTISVLWCSPLWMSRCLFDGTANLVWPNGLKHTVGVYHSSLISPCAFYVMITGLMLCYWTWTLWSSNSSSWTVSSCEVMYSSPLI